MRKAAFVAFLAVALLALGAGSSHAGSSGGSHGGSGGGSHGGSWHGGSSHGSSWHGGSWHGGGRVFVGVGPAFWWGRPYPYYSWGYYPPAYYYPPPVVVQEPSVYVSQPQPPLAPAPTAQAYWYYCASAQAYYPNVPSCPEAWIKVPPIAE